MVEYVEIFGKEYPVRIGYYVMKKIKEETGKDFQEALKEAHEGGKIELHEKILFYALKMGAIAEREESKFDLEMEDMEIALDLCFPKYVELLSSDSFFPQEMQDKVAEGQAALEQQKPKQNPKKQKKKKAAQQT